MTFALIFAGGTGRRMSTRSKPQSNFWKYMGSLLLSIHWSILNMYEMVDAVTVVCIERVDRGIMGTAETVWDHKGEAADRTGRRNRA